MENEFEKLKNISNEKINLEDVSLLMSEKNDLGIDDLFFSVLLDSKQILKKSTSIIDSPSVAYFFLNRVMFFLDILLRSDNASDLNKNFPPYLFKEKTKFQTMHKKINVAKKLKILEMVKKSELLIRKNNKMYIIVIQRFLLNLKKQVS